MVTLSLIKADIGGLVGHSAIHPALEDVARDSLEHATQQGLLIDYHVTHCGDDLQLIMTHERDEDDPAIHQLAWQTFQAGTDIARKLKLYGAGQDLLADAFAGNVRGMGPGVAEVSFDERRSEPVVCLMADKTSAGAWNIFLYKAFADPFNTAGLVIADALHQGFAFELTDVREHKRIVLEAPEESYDLLVLLGAPSHYAVKRIYSRTTGEVAAVSSTERLAQIAGRYVGKDDPVCIVRCQGAFPAVGEVLEPFTTPFLVQGWMRGSHHGPLMPVAQRDANVSSFDGPPRVIALGFQLADGKLIGPRDLFDDPQYDAVRRQASEIAGYLRQHGPFEPHRLPLEEMEYTTMAEVAMKLVDRWEPWAPLVTAN